MKTVIFREIEDTSGAFEVLVDGTLICEVTSDRLDVGDAALEPLWQALGINVEFEEEE